MTDFESGMLAGIVLGAAVHLVLGLLERRTEKRLAEQRHMLKLKARASGHDPIHWADLIMTKADGELVAITLQDEESRILRVLWEKEDGLANFTNRQSSEASN
jgi:hypothetical protein